MDFTFPIVESDAVPEDTLLVVGSGVRHPGEVPPGVPVMPLGRDAVFDLRAAAMIRSGRFSGPDPLEDLSDCRHGCHGDCLESGSDVCTFPCHL